MKIKMKLFASLTIMFAVLFCLGVFGGGYNAVAKAEQTENEQSTETETHSHCICGGTTDVGDHTEHKNVVYSPWTGGNFDYDGDDGNSGVAYLYLTSDVVNDAGSCNRVDKDSGILTIKSTQTLYLCLNGHSLKNNKTDNNVIDVEGTLYLCDCAGNGSIGGRTSGSSSGAVWVGSNATFYMYGGTLTGSHGLKNGGGMYLCNNSKATMYGGAIKGNTAARRGGGVFSDGGNFVMHGGTISNNSAPESGGGVIMNSGTFTMNGGSIENNVSGSYGGGAYVAGGTFTMNGGTISGNIAANGGGVCATTGGSRGTFVLNNGTISENSATNGGGVYVWDRGSFIMKNGSISNNKAIYGGGISIFSANSDNKNINNILEIYSGEIKNNSASGYGGGICCFQYSNVKLYGDGAIVIDKNENSNLYLADICPLTVSTLAEGSLIGVSSMVKPENSKTVTVFTGTIDAESLKYFYSDNFEYAIKYDEGTTVLTADCFKSTIKYETGCDQTIPSQTKSGLTESIELNVTDVKPNMPCHIFRGWAEADSLNVVRYNPGDAVTVTEETTLYAVWESVPHKLNFVDEVNATCDHDGVKSHYSCSECGKTFIDSEATTETTAEQLVLPAGHKFGAWHETVEATTEKEGTLAHKDCELCGKHFDANGNEISNLTINKLPAKNDSSLSTGSIIGISVGATAVAVIGLEAAIYFIIKVVAKKRRNI